MSISAAMVMKLRERTGVGMMECKKFLIASNGDIEQAIIEMRKAGQAKADKKSDRITAEGIVIIAHTADNHRAVILEINSETDFAARDNDFNDFARKVAETALDSGVTDLIKLSAVHMPCDSKHTVEQARQELVAKIGENIKLRRIQMLTCDDGVVGWYLHAAKIGVLVSIKNGDESLAKDVAMHIAASRPTVVSPTDISADAIASEREILNAQMQESTKSAEIIQQIVENRISKFCDESSLIGQSYIKNPSIKVGQFLKEHHAEAVAFVCFEVGEGIEKKEDNFVAEVMAQVR